MCCNPSKKIYGYSLSSDFEGSPQFNNNSAPLISEHIETIFPAECRQALWSIAQFNQSIKLKLGWSGASFSLLHMVILDAIKHHHHWDLPSRPVRSLCLETCAYAPCDKPSDLPRLAAPVSVTRPSSYPPGMGAALSSRDIVPVWPVHKGLP